MISVIIPTYNQIAYIAQAVNSALAQTRLPDEILVINNASTDDTARHIPQHPLVRVVTAEVNRGPSAARNLGIQQAKGDVLVFLDGDDLMAPTCVEKRVGMLESADDVGIVIGSYRLVTAEGAERNRETPKSKSGEIDQNLAVFDITCPTCGMVVRAKAFADCGAFDESLRVAEDADVLIRITAKYRALCDPEALADYRMVSGSLSRSYAEWYDGHRRMFAKNQSAARSRAAYAWWSTVALFERTVDRVFSKVVREGGFAGLRKEVFPLMLRRPLMAVIFVYWLFRLPIFRLIRLAQRVGR